MRNAAYTFAALLLGAAMPFAFSPYDHAWLAIPALTGWLWLIRRGLPWRVGFAFGFGWFGFGGWWLAPTLHTFGHLSWLAAGFCVALVGMVMGMLPALWSWVTWKLSEDSNRVIYVFPAAAVAEEWLRGHIFTGLPWTALGNLLLDTPAVGWGAWFGVYGLALLPALCAAALVLVLFTPGRFVGRAGLLVTLLLFFVAPAPMPGEGVAHRVALIQANIPQDKKWDRHFVHETMQRYARLSAAAASDVDLIIWPEAAVPFFLSRAPGWDAWLTAQVKAWQRPLLFGGLKMEAGRSAQNGLFAHDPKLVGLGSQRRGFVGKHHLVPFGEYVPAWIPFLHTLVPEIADFKPADDAGVLKVRGIDYGALNCYESLFPEEARARVLHGAEVLVNITNDAWYGTTPAAWQHFQAARMRAVESGRYVLRAANTGVTAIISPDGVVRQQLPWWQQGALRGTFQISHQRTHYLRWGDWPLLTVAVILLVAWASSWRRNLYAGV